MEIHPTTEGHAIHLRQSRARGVNQREEVQVSKEIKRRREEVEKERWDRSPEGNESRLHSIGTNCRKESCKFVDIVSSVPFSVSVERVSLWPRGSRAASYPTPSGCVPPLKYHENEKG